MDVKCVICSQECPSICERCLRHICSETCLIELHDVLKVDCEHPTLMTQHKEARRATQIEIPFSLLKPSQTVDSLLWQDADGKVSFYISKLLGKGNYGQVYEACMNANCEVVVKLQGYSQYKGFLQSDKRWWRERDISILASAENFGPKLFYANIVPLESIAMNAEPGSEFATFVDSLRKHRAEHIGIFVLQKWTMSLNSYLPQYWVDQQTPDAKNNIAMIQYHLQSAMIRMWMNGYVHGDLVPNNVLVNLDAKMNVTGCRPADFGLSFAGGKAKQEIPSLRLEVLMKYLLNPRHYPREFPPTQVITDNWKADEITVRPILLDYPIFDWLTAAQRAGAPPSKPGTVSESLHIDGKHHKSKGKQIPAWKAREMLHNPPHGIPLTPAQEALFRRRAGET